MCQHSTLLMQGVFYNLLNIGGPSVPSHQTSIIDPRWEGGQSIVLRSIAVRQDSPRVKVFRARYLYMDCTAFGTCRECIPLVVHVYQAGVWEI